MSIGTRSKPITKQRAKRSFRSAGRLGAKTASLLIFVSACSWTTEPTGEEAALARFEKTQQTAQGLSSDSLVVAVIEGDAALTGDDPGEGWFTAVYRREGAAWKRIADKGNAPAQCLFDRAHIDASTARTLTARLFARAAGMKPDAEHVRCRP